LCSQHPRPSSILTAVEPILEMASAALVCVRSLVIDHYGDALLMLVMVAVALSRNGSYRAPVSM
jgi:hypothetical protein